MEPTPTTVSPQHRPWSRIITGIVGSGMIAGLGIAGYALYQQDQKIAALLEDRQYFLLELASSTKQVENLSVDRDQLQEQLAIANDTLTTIERELRSEQNRNEAFADQISELAGTVVVLDKLAKTDKELLQKYSKVSFLNEHYVPERLREIADEWKYDESRSHQLHHQVIPFLDDMLEAAKDDGVELWVVSAYRSFDTQAQLKAGYTVRYGSGANAFSADQGFSEHQLGTTVDFTTRGLQGGLDGFDKTEAYEWLLDNAHRYGFTLSYPQGNSYYIFEPWHWRFVGTDLARDLQRANAHFYDWEQRKIDEYLVGIFD